ncbi:MAG: AAA family ATPase [Chromatiaceae bacterium]|nr:AAA family ATPase [Chromatiaceae bacterium]
MSYGDIAAANDAPWQKVRRLVPNHLGSLVVLAHERGWPMLSAIVVNKQNLDSGEISGNALDGFLGAAEMIGEHVGNPANFVREQQRQVFEWAKTAPDELDVEEDAGTDATSGPRFVKYFGLVLDALRALGGSASPHDVYAWIKERFDVPAEELKAKTQGGQSRFENDVGWARFYLTKAGLIDGSKRGTWALTTEGRETELDHDTALDVFRDVATRFRTGDNEDAPAPEGGEVHELFADPKRQFWFVGAVWGGTNDKLDEFIEKGIWQNGYDNKFGEHVQRMRPGDRIAIKASFVKKHNLPFDNRGKAVSCMRIKAVGTVTENLGDGRTVKVDWEKLDPPRDWYFYTYRVTVVEADPTEDLSRRLILFAFGGAKQDYNFWINDVPYFAKRYGAVAKPAVSDELETEEESEEDASLPSYTVDNILEEGCFLAREALDSALARIVSKKNLILQGPPGTGKTWLAKKLAYALIGSRDRKATRGRLRIVQFHPSLSYEDFVRGYRPAGGGLELVDGIFLEAVQAASAEPDRPHVLIIEEINRGNPAQVFGEMLTLLEDSKRSSQEAIELAYRREEGETVFIPKNLHVIGTMNIADRSLALVDLALRRRFAFVNLEPQLNEAWQSWCKDRGLDDAVISMIEQRMRVLNEEIAADRSLGPQYQVGHSYVTPLEGAMLADGGQWFRDVALTEIVPLLEEYWFDAPDKVDAVRGKLLEGL